MSWLNGTNSRKHTRHSIGFYEKSQSNPIMDRKTENHGAELQNNLQFGYDLRESELMNVNDVKNEVNTMK